MALEVVALHLFLPVFAGALVAWWRARAPVASVRRQIIGGLLIGAGVLLIDVAILVAPVAIRDPRGEGDPYLAVLMSVLIFGCVGAVLGLTGALLSAALAVVRDRLTHHGGGDRLH